MRISDGHSIIYSPPTDRRQEFVDVLELVLPQVAAGIESLGFYLVMAAVWGTVLFIAVATLASR